MVGIKAGRSKGNTNRNKILWLLALAKFLVVLDSAIVNVALPAIHDGLGFSESALQWIIMSYVLTFGGFLILGGRMADLYGRRRMLVLGAAGFGAASLLLGLANSGPTLVALRAFQGLSAALMTPAALSILLATFKEGRGRNKALSAWSAVASAGAAAGVFLGGVITQYLGWRWIFLVNVPICLLAIAGIIKYVPAHMREAKNKSLDVTGAILITGGLGALMYALTSISQEAAGLSPVMPWLALSFALLAAFMLSEKRARHPLVPLSIFRIRNVSAGNFIMLPVVACALGVPFFLSLYLQQVLNYSPLLTGLSFLPMPITVAIVSAGAPSLLARFDFKQLLVAGTALMASGIWLLSFLTVDSSYATHILPAFVIIAAGSALSFVAGSLAATSGIPSGKTGLASGLLNASQRVGGALGLTVLAVAANTVISGGIADGQELVLARVQGYQMAALCAALLMVVALISAIFLIRAPSAKTLTQKYSAPRNYS